MKNKRLSKIILFSSLVTLIAVSVLAATGSAGAIQSKPDLYWLTYIQNGKGVFLMEIDSTGKVIKAPVFMGNFGPAISRNGTDKINLWTFKKREEIDKKTLAVVKTVNTKIFGPNSVTDKLQKNFAVTAGSQEPTLRFAGVSPTGTPNGATWKIDSGLRCDRFGCASGVVSSDGKMILWVEFSLLSPGGIFIQPLLDTGRPNGSHKIVSNDSVSNGTLSNVLPDGKIFLILQESDELVLQIVDAQTGQEIGDKILLRHANFGFRPVGIDPLGHFVIYSYKNQQNVHFLSFQALDATGDPSGASKVLLRKVDAYDIHLLKD